MSLQMRRETDRIQTERGKERDVERRERKRNKDSFQEELKSWQYEEVNEDLELMTDRVIKECRRKCIQDVSHTF